MTKEAAPKSAPSAAGASEPYEVLARRTRPQTFAEVVGQEHVTRTLANAIEQGRLGHAFIFSGMRGVGKTTTARILAKALNCIDGPTPTPCNVCVHCVEITEGRSLDVFEVDAASQTGIDATRELLETVKYQPASARFRIYIIDEAHGLSRQAVDAFLKTLEEPPPHAKFILATTAPQKLTSTILSRCQRYDFRSVSVTEVIGALQSMLSKEGKKADDAALAILARESGGSLRDATSLLEQVLAFADGEIDAATVHASLGLPDREALRQLIGALKARDAGRALGIVADIVGQGADLTRFAVELLEELRHLTVLKVASRAALTDLMETEIEALEELAADASADDLQRWFRILLRGQEEIGRSAVPRLVLEMAVVEMATLPELVAIDILVERLEALSAGGSVGGGGGALTSRSPQQPAARAAIPTAGAQPGLPAPSSKAAPAATRPAPSRPRPAEPAAERPPAPEQPRWKELVDRLQKEKASRFFRLSYSRLLEVTDGELRIGVTGRDAVTALTAPGVRADIEAAIEDQFGTKLRFAPVVLDESGSAPKVANLEKEAREDPVVKLSMELLDGKIEAVLPREDRGE
ncbi:MAG: DNA polymerase III subunit gamma/tau [Deltaproteobacteria bacterium]